MGKLLKLRALVVAGVGPLLACATVLGGLDEGAARSDAGTARDTATDAGGAACPGWLGGFRFRSPWVVQSSSDVRDVQVRVVIDTQALMASGDLRSDGADMRITAADGVTVAPHWVEGGLGTRETVLWTKLDLSAAGVRFYLYGGSSSAADTSSIEATFVQGAIESPSFDRPSVWPATATGFAGLPSRNNEWSAVFGDGAVTMRVIRQPDPNGAMAGVCQTVLLPAGAKYSLDFDANVRLADHGVASVWLDGMAGTSLWFSPPEVTGPVRGASFRSLDPGLRTLCLGVNTVAPDAQGVEVVYTRPRLRRLAIGEVRLEGPGAREVTPCP